jgi:hypothetical protein
VASSETNEALQWHDPEWVAEAVEWIDANVDRAGDIDHFHSYPWATAFRVPTDDGPVWFKACIDELAPEVGTLELLGARRPDLVPRLITGDRSRGWMLLADAGERMRELESQPGQLERWERAVSEYAQLQLDVADDAEAFVAAGVPDRRGMLLAEQLERLLEDGDALQPAVDEALSDAEVAEVRALVPRIAGEVQQLASLDLPETIQHDDLHDANVFVRDGRYRIIDWGDACVANPLLSLSVALGVVASRFGIEADAPEVERVRDAYLEPFSERRSRAELVTAMPIVLRLGGIANAIKWHEIVGALPEWTRGPYADVVPYKLRQLLERCA